MPAKARTTPSLRIRIDYAATHALGPGKVRLLELIEETGSISAAGRALKMSYRRAWLLVEELNGMFGEPVVVAQKGGGGGGGTQLTDAGRRVVKHYRHIEECATSASSADLRALQRMLARAAGA